MEERELLAQLVNSLGNLNVDSEGGILNRLAWEYNRRLEMLALPVIYYCPQYNISVSYDEDTDKVTVIDKKDNVVAIVIEDASYEIDEDDLQDPTGLLYFIERFYMDELEEYFEG